jgi:hypothetical protein
MKQIKVSLYDSLRTRLEEAAEQSGSSLSDEIRRRLEYSVQQDGISPETRGLLHAIEDLADLVKAQTGHSWNQHSAANRVLREAIVARLQRQTGAEEATFQREELPSVRLVAAGSDDPSAMALALEAIVEFDLRRQDEREKELVTMRRRYHAATTEKPRETKTGAKGKKR